MTTSRSFRALRAANPRTRAGFSASVEAVAASARAQIDTPVELPKRSGPRRPLARLSAAGVTLAAAAAAAVFTVGSTGGGPGVENAAAAVEQAAAVTAASAERSGTAVVRMTRDGQPWAGKNVRWNGGDLSVVEDAAPGRPPRELRLVDGTLYGQDAGGGWLDVGSLANIDPGSGTTPDDYLAAVQEDVGGETLRRITTGMTGLTTRKLGDGSAVYGGKVPAGLIARETGFKEGQPIRVLPFGYVAHDEAADPSSPLDVNVTVGSDGIVREIAVTWGSTGAAWTYTVDYTGLGATPAPVAPAGARSLEEVRRAAVR